MPDYVADYLAERGDAPRDGERQVEKSSGLGGAEIVRALADPRLGERGLEFMADLMHPTESRYYDAIFGSEYGQADIRRWLFPTMDSIEFIAFMPQAEPVVIAGDEYETSLDEWQMVATIEGNEIPLSKGTSVRRYRDGWITWACDVYDTGAFRNPPEGTPPPDFPPVPREDWPRTVPRPEALSQAAETWVRTRRAARESGKVDPGAEPSGLEHRDMHAILEHPDTSFDFDLMADLMHPTESRYLDPLFGEFEGREPIRTWLTDIMSKVGRIAFEPIGPSLFDGSVSLQEWVQVAVQPDGSRVPMIRGTSVRRFADGFLRYAADYFDTAALAHPDVIAASTKAGSRITAEDVARYR